MTTSNPAPGNNPGLSDEAAFNPDDLRAMLAQDFRNKAELRRSHARQFPENEGNEQASEILLQLAETVSWIPESYCLELNALLKAELPEDRNFYLEALHEAIRKVGFRKDEPECDSAAEFLEEFLLLMPEPHELQQMREAKAILQRRSEGVRACPR